jgi:fimbrial chaperone protein
VGTRSVFFALAALAAAAWLSPASAGTFTISPLRVDLSRATSTAVLSVRNEDAAEVVVQVEALEWRQADGEDVLEASRDLVASPMVFTLPAGGQQLLRVALRRAPDAARELSYRLVLQEVPQAARPGFTGLQVALRLSLPVFVAADAPTHAPLAWTLERATDGALTVSARNAGQSHERVLGFSLMPDAGGPALEQAVAAYVLPGQTRRWRLPGTTDSTVAPGATRYVLRGRTDAGEFETSLTPTP